MPVVQEAMAAVLAAPRPPTPGLEQEWRRLRRLQGALTRERRTFTEAAERLAREVGTPCTPPHHHRDPPKPSLGGGTPTGMGHPWGTAPQGPPLWGWDPPPWVWGPPGGGGSSPNQTAFPPQWEQFEAERVSLLRQHFLSTPDPWDTPDPTGDPQPGGRPEPQP